MGEVFCANHKVGYFEIDKQERILPQGVLLLFQELATAHSEAVGRGLEWLLQSNRGWAITNMHLKFYGLPKYREEIKIMTWAHKMRKMQAYRNFAAEGADGGLICEGMSLWIYLDLESRGPSVIPPEMEDVYLCDTKAPPFEKEKFLFPKAVEGELVSEYRFRVKRGDTDTNGHTNNVRYLEWAMDGVPDDIYDNGVLEDLQIIFRKECYRGSEILQQTHVSETEDGKKKVSVRMLDGADPSVIFAQVQLIYGC